MPLLQTHPRSTDLDTDRRPGTVDAASTGRFGVWVYIGWLSTGVIEGPLRGGLSVIGMANLLYLRDLVVVLTIALAFARPLLRGGQHPPGLVLGGWVLAVHLCIGILLGGNLFNAFFGLKIFFPLLYAVAIFPAVEKNFALFIRAMAVFFLVSTIGVFVNDAVGELPWEGMSYDTAFGSVNTTKTWWMEGGLRRLPGLARTSVDVAMIIGVSSVILLGAVHSVWLRALIVALAIWAIVLSTSKGMVLAFGIATLWLVPFNRSVRSFKLGRTIVAALLLLTCLVPTLFMIMSVPSHPVDIPPLLSSMWERFSWMWPNAYALIPDWFGALTGAGLGGIGTPLGILPDPNSADSVFVYYYASFGVLGVVYLAFPMVAILGRRGAADGQAFVWAGLLIIAYGYGLSTNMIEQTFFAGVLGLLYGKAFAACQPQRARA